jgi:hypothetical protein
MNFGEIFTIFLIYCKVIRAVTTHWDAANIHLMLNQKSKADNSDFCRKFCFILMHINRFKENSALTICSAAD